MNCNGCKKCFNSHANIPRLLILCGHSLCEACLYKLHSNLRIQCPECHSYTYVDNICLLPKNLALLSVNSTQDQGICEKHNKKYEAFCEKDRVLICVDCILQDGYRKSPMESIKNAYAKEYEKFSKNVERANKLYGNLEQKIHQHQMNEQQSKENFFNYKKNISEIFKEIREAINKQQVLLLSKCEQSYKYGCYLVSANQGKSNQRSDFYVNSIQKVEQCLENLRSGEQHSQLLFLQNTTIRQLQFRQINLEVPEPLKPFNFSYSKAQITESVVRILEKSVKAVNPQNQPKKHPEVTAKVIKKLISPAPQNKQLVKKNPKRQSMFPSNNLIAHQRNQSNNNVLQKFDINSKCQISTVQQKQSMMNSFLSNMTYLINDKKVVHIIGGLSQNQNSVFKLNLNNMAWQQGSVMSSGRSKFGAISINREIYVFGGKKGKERVCDGQVYRDGEWTSGYGISRAKSGFGVVSVGEWMYLVGGNDGEAILGAVECLNIQTGEWRKKEAMREPRDELCLVVGNDCRMYAIGGFGGVHNQPLSSVEVYDPLSDKWAYAPSMNCPRRALAAASLADGIYAIGGFDGSTYMNSVEKLQQGSKQWVVVGSLNQARCTHSAISIFETQEIYVFGGFDYVALDTVEKFSVITNEWEIVSRMPSPRFMHSSVLIRE